MTRLAPLLLARLLTACGGAAGPDEDIPTPPSARCGTLQQPCPKVGP